MKRAITALSAVAVLGAAAVALAQSGGAPPAGGGGAPAPAAPRAQRIVIVNIAKVLKEYNKANNQGAEITTLREQYVAKVNAKRTLLKSKNDEYQKAVAPDVKTKLENEAKAIQRDIEDIDLEAQKVLTQKSNDVIVSVYKEIKGTIADIAKANNLDMVLCYPAATDEKMESSPAVAQLMLQTPALIPFYHQGMDISHVVVQTLNTRYPSPTPPKRDGLPTADPKPPTPPVGGGMK